MMHVIESIFVLTAAGVLVFIGCALYVAVMEDEQDTE